MAYSGLSLYEGNSCAHTQPPVLEFNCIHAEIEELQRFFTIVGQGEIQEVAYVGLEFSVNLMDEASANSTTDEVIIGIQRFL